MKKQEVITPPPFVMEVQEHLLQKDEGTIHNMIVRRLSFCDDRHALSAKAVYVDENGRFWESHVKKNGFLYGYAQFYRFTEPWKVMEKPFDMHCAVIMNDSEELKEIAKRLHPFGYAYMRKCINEHDRPALYPSSIAWLIQAPYLEQLCKAGFAFAKDILFPVNISNRYRYQQIRLAELSRLCKNGRNLKEIFKTSKCVYETLKAEPDLKVWDIYRKMDKTGKTNKDNLSRIYESRFTEKQLKLAYEVLGKTWNNVPVYTWDSLVRYLERVNIYEAIETEEALQLLRDYLWSCNYLDVSQRQILIL